MTRTRKEKMRTRTKQKRRPKSRRMFAKASKIVTRKARMSKLMKILTPRTALRYALFANVSSRFMFTSNRKY